jgi:hypothetical protein
MSNAAKARTPRRSGAAEALENQGAEEHESTKPVGSCAWFAARGGPGDRGARWCLRALSNTHNAWRNTRPVAW